MLTDESDRTSSSWELWLEGDPAAMIYMRRRGREWRSMRWWWWLLEVSNDFYSLKITFKTYLPSGSTGPRGLVGFILKTRTHTRPDSRPSAVARLVLRLSE